MNQQTYKLDSNTLDLDVYKAYPYTCNQGDQVHDKNQQNGHLVVKCQVKWFREADGYGFVQTVEGTQTTWLTPDDDIFIHSSKCDLKQVQVLRSGDFLRCKVARGLRGPQVEEIYEYYNNEEKKCKYIKGFIKWFDVQKGFGFVIAEPGHENTNIDGRDIFLPGTRVRQLGINQSKLKINTQVTFTYKFEPSRNQCIVDQIQLLEE